MIGNKYGKWYVVALFANNTAAVLKHEDRYSWPTARIYFNKIDYSKIKYSSEEEIQCFERARVDLCKFLGTEYIK